MKDHVWYVGGKRDISVLISAFRRSGAVVKTKKKQDVYDMIKKLPESSGIPIMVLLDPDLSQEFIEMLTDWRSNLKWYGPGQTPSFIFLVSKGNLDEAQKKWDPTDEKAFDFIEYDSLLEEDITKSELKKAQRARITAEFGFIIGKTEPMNEVYKAIDKVVNFPVNVLIRGESGTGKELVARSIHRLRNRSNQPFVPINCASFPKELIESELFGHEKGAFTGAHQDYSGLIKQADQGTLFLDEIGDLQMKLQPKLLRFLQDKKIRRIGGNKEMLVDVRVLSATNKDLDQMVTERAFRQDLLYRLRVIEIFVPPLRDHMDDVPDLIKSFFVRLAINGRAKLKHFHPKAEAALLAYRWPGNVRELESAVTRGYVLSDGDQITFDDLPPEIKRNFENQLTGQPAFPNCSVKARPGSVSKNRVGSKMKRCIFNTLQEMSEKPNVNISDELSRILASFNSNGTQDIFSVIRLELNPNDNSVFDPDSRTQDRHNLKLAINLTCARLEHTETLLQFVGYIRNTSSGFIKNRLGLNKANTKKVIPELADWFRQSYDS